MIGIAWVRIGEYRVSPLSFDLTSFAPLIVSDIAPGRLDRFFFDAPQYLFSHRQPQLFACMTEMRMWRGSISLLIAAPRLRVYNLRLHRQPSGTDCVGHV